MKKETKHRTHPRNLVFLFGILKREKRRDGAKDIIKGNFTELKLQVSIFKRLIKQN